MITVMIIDGSAVVRESLVQLIRPCADIKVLATAMNIGAARHKLNKNWPDVIILDIEPPSVAGLQFLQDIMTNRPTPVIVSSTQGENSVELNRQALHFGAVEAVVKPQAGLRSFFQQHAEDIVRSIRQAAGKKRPASGSVSLGRNLYTHSVPKKLSADVILPLPKEWSHPRTEKIVVLGTSTGGTHALEAVLMALPPQAPPIAIVQHMPELFTQRFAERLDALCRVEVLEARQGDQLKTGRVLIAPGGKHLLIKRDGERYYVDVRDGPLVSRHRPSVDVLFRSAAIAAGANALGVIMTGMGDDGAQGLKEMRDSGSRTFAQSAESCVVFGMPKEALDMGAAERSVHLKDIAALLCSWR